MVNNPSRAKKIDLGNTIWISLLSECIDALGKDQFTDHLLDALKSITGFDYSVCFAYHQNKKPICLFHSFTLQERVVFVDDYLKGPYLLDPFFKACGRKVEAGLNRLRDIAPDRFLQSEYYRSYYVRTGLAEEISYSCYLHHDVAIVISLMRSGKSPRFSAREFRLLETVAPIICSLAQQHWHAVPDWFEVDAFDREPGGDYPTIVEDTVGDVFGPRITPRETQVVAQVLEGHSSESIAKSLGISVGTVRIHRRNIYAKLAISSQEELFSIFFQKIRTVRA
ncbi:MAG: DNA-binding CsgD family transcriptional regulator [Gammaproteobacteria bacterium]|jgi:DNA-binding CsgD family transcriptional regulator